MALAKGRKYTPEEVKVALDAYYAMGDVSVTKAAKILGIHQRTLAGWIKNPDLNSRLPPPEVETNYRKRISRQLLEVAHRIIELTTDADIKKASIQGRFSALKVAVDIAQLLDGEPTSIRAEAMTEEKRLELIIDMAQRIESRRKSQDGPKEIGFIETHPSSVEGDRPPSDEAAVEEEGKSGSAGA